MNHKLTQEEFDSLWYTPYGRIWKDPRHFEVVPIKELVFEGPFHSARVATLTLKSVCNSKAAYIVESSSPDRFAISSTIGIVEPGGVVIVRIIMYPNVANEPHAIHIFKLSSIPVIEPMKLSLVTRRWMEVQPHNLYEESWTCKFDQPMELTAFYDCQYLPLPPPPPAVTRRQRAVGAEVKVWRKKNQELSFRVQTLRDERESLMQGEEDHLPENLDDYLEGVFLLLGMDVRHLLVRDIRNTILYMEIGIFIIGMLIGKIFM